MENEQDTVTITVPRFLAPRLIRIAKQYRQKSCLHCSKTFFCGTGTGRRADAKFCSDECRVEHHSLARTPS